jgi:hypothetical protein
VGRGKTLLGGARGLTQGVLGGWQLSGTTALYTGQPFTVRTSDADLALGESQRPNRLAKGQQADLPGVGKRGVDYPWFRLTDFEEVPPCVDRTNCPTSPNGFSPFQFGNSGRSILDGPGLAYLNFALTKNFRMKEQRNLQFRFEAFSVLNRANFLLPNNNFNETTGGTITRVRDAGRGGPRVMQFALKYEF